MRHMQAAHKEWYDFRDALERGEASAGIVLIEGTSEVIAQEVQSLLQHASLKGETCQYFLSSGSEQFRVPYYISFAEGEAVAEPIRPFHILQEQPSIKRQPLLAVGRLEQSMADASSMPHFVVLEYMTPPGQHNLIFTSQLFRSPLSRLIPILIFVHRCHHSDKQLPAERTVEEMLSLLYLCGGRVRAADWDRLIDRPVESQCDALLLASRRIASETWVCYAHRGVAEMAGELYRAMDQDKRQKIARNAIKALPNNTSYPLLAIAAETGEIEAMQSKYSLKVLNAALGEPNSVVRYFKYLHRLAQKADADPLGGVAYICYLAAFIYVDPVQALQIYQNLQETGLAQVEQTTQAAFWAFIGHKYAVLSTPEAWSYATECFYRSRSIVDNLYQAGKIKRIGWGFYLAGIAKVEALIAYKSGQGERTCQLMEFAIAELGQRVSNLSYLIDVRINFGDAFLRLLGDPQSAITQYEEALGALLRMSRELKSRPGLGGLGESRAAQKLGDTLVLVERYGEAIQLFEMLLSRLANVATLDGKDLAQRRLKARLALAEAYLKVKRPRSAAVCYWLILRRSDWLGSEELQDTAAKLRTQRPNLHKRLHRRIDTIITIQENVMMDMLTIQRNLSDL
ncbi:MAG TPA: hypothetical protein VKR06_37495 [Ktedonosporobacter sp.]|nr:hypothetical protein [Ktedonosporobacter sp.]